VIQKTSSGLFKYYNTGLTEPLILQPQISCSNYIFTLKRFIKEYVSIRYCLRHSNEEKALAFLSSMDWGMILKWDLKKWNELSLIGLIWLRIGRSNKLLWTY